MAKGKREKGKKAEDGDLNLRDQKSSVKEQESLKGEDGRLSEKAKGK